MEGDRSDEMEELRASRRRIVLAAVAERRSIERALHDGLQQSLVTLATDLELAMASLDADPVAAASLLADVRRDVQQAIEGARDLAEWIYPPLLEAGGLGVALRSAASRLDVPIRIDLAVGTVLPLEIASLVFTCCVEVLERLVQGTAVTVTVRVDEEAVGFRIEAASVVDPGSLVSDRIEALGGQLTTDQDGQRTTVRASLPLSG